MILTRKIAELNLNLAHIHIICRSYCCSRYYLNCILNSSVALLENSLRIKFCIYCIYTKIYASI